MTSEFSRSRQRREREREHRCQTILDAAESLFVDQGFLKTSVDQIADKAEVSVGTVYFYFKNKEALLSDLFDKSLFLLRSILGKKFETAPTPIMGMEMAGHAFFDEFCTRHAQNAMILFREAVSQGQHMESRRKKMSQAIAIDLSHAIERLGRESGHNFTSPESPLVFAHCILGVYEKLAFHYLTEPRSPEQKKAMAQNAVEFTLGGVQQITDPPSTKFESK